MQPDLPPFETLHFGHIDAVQEAVEDPDLLRDGYFDYKQAVKGITMEHTWLVLGPKGSGKSAVLENLRLNWKDRFDRFFNYWDLSGFAVGDVTSIGTGQPAGAARSQAAWEFLLLLRIVETLARDNGLNCGSSFIKLEKGLRTSGLLAGDWTSKLAQWTGATVKFDAKLVGVETTWGPREITPLDVSAYVKQVLAEVSTDSAHIVALDGLDSFFFEVDSEWRSLAGLTSAVYAANRLLADLGLRVRVVVAARSDIIDVLPGPEVTKLKPHSVHLDWHAKGIGPENNLWNLLTMKAHVRAPAVKSIVNQYLQTKISIGPHISLSEFLLDNTRLLPRDAVALMGYLQKCYRGNKQVTEQSAKNAVRMYSEEYFVSEIFDNLAGVLPASRARSVASFRDALRTAPSRLFDFQYMREELDGELTPAEIKLLLKQMFEVGGIGIKNGVYTDFVFRRVSGAGFTHRYEFLLHDALTRAWNRPWR